MILAGSPRVKRDGAGHVKGPGGLVARFEPIGNRGDARSAGQQILVRWHRRRRNVGWDGGNGFGGRSAGSEFWPRRFGSVRSRDEKWRGRGERRSRGLSLGERRSRGLS